MDKRIENEKKRLYMLLDRAGVTDSRRDYLEDIINNASFMRVKLEESRAEMESASLTIPYDNGGGQSGIRKNPLFEAYEALLKHYLLTMDKILAVLPKSLENDLRSFTDDTDNVIEMVKSLKVKAR